MDRNSTSLLPCDKMRCLPINKYNCIDSTSCLVVPVTIHHICPNSTILVIVELFIKNKLYSRQIKKIFTGNVDNCNCCTKEKLIDCLFVDNFKFYFINECVPKYINVDVNIQYIYNC